MHSHGCSYSTADHFYSTCLASGMGLFDPHQMKQQKPHVFDQGSSFAQLARIKELKMDSLMKVSEEDKRCHSISSTEYQREFWKKFIKTNQDKNFDKLTKSCLPLVFEKTSEYPLKSKDETTWSWGTPKTSKIEDAFLSTMQIKLEDKTNRLVNPFFLSKFIAKEEIEDKKINIIMNAVEKACKLE